MARQCFRVKRGMVFWYEPPKSATKTCVQQGNRPWLVVSNDDGNISAPTCNVVPLTTEDKTHLPVHVRVYLNGQENNILCEQSITVDQNVLKDFVCVMTDETMAKVDEALTIQYAIKPVVKYMDFNMTNLVEKLESMIGEIIKEKAEQMSQKVSDADLEDSALRLGQMIEDLMGTSKKPEGKAATIKTQANIEIAATKADVAPNKVAHPAPKKKKPATKKSSTQKTKWTIELRCQFLKDCDKMSPDEVRKKYGFSKVSSVFSTKYNCKNVLKEMGIDYENYSSKEVASGETASGN